MRAETIMKNYAVEYGYGSCQYDDYYAVVSYAIQNKLTPTQLLMLFDIEGVEVTLDDSNLNKRVGDVLFENEFDTFYDSQVTFASSFHEGDTEPLLEFATEYYDDLMKDRVAEFLEALKDEAMDLWSATAFICNNLVDVKLDPDILIDEEAIDCLILYAQIYANVIPAEEHQIFYSEFDT